MRSPLLPVLLLLLSTLGCESHSKIEGQGSPVIYAFHPGRANLNPGSSTLLLANFVGGTGTIDQGVGVVSSGLPVLVSPGTSKVYTLTVKGPTGDPAVATTTISVGAMSVDISPAQVGLTSGQTQAFTATVLGLADTRIKWSGEGGTIDNLGVFTAGGIPGTYLVSAQSLAEPTLCAKSFVTVTASPVLITVNPATPILTAGRSLTLTALVTGTSNTGVTWSVSAGAITSGGVFTAPALPGIVSVTATSAADPTKSASATVTVVAPATASLAPSTATPLYGATNVTVTPTFTGGAAVVGTSQGAANTAATPVSGTAIAVQSAGFKSATTYWIRVTNAAGDAVDASSTITPQTVVVGALSPGNPTVNVASSTVFSSTITGGALGTVTWSSSGGTWVGSTWTAPALAGSTTITATSNDDPTKSASTTVTVVDLPVITAFTLRNIGTLAPNWVLNATYTGGTGTVNLGAGPLLSGGVISLGLTHADVYTLTVTNAAGTNATRTASAILLQVDSPSNPSNLLPGRTVPVLVTVLNATNTAVSYAASKGSITSGGVFTAPLAVGACTLTVTSQADPTVTATILVKVMPLVLPQSQVVAPSASFVFRAPMLGIANTAVTWSLVPATFGTISPQGVFISNGTTGSFSVVATAVADPTISGSAFVTVPSGFVYANSLTPTTGTAITTRRTQHALTRTASDLVLASGGLNGGVPMATLETYNGSGQFWTASGVTLTQARSRHTATLLPTGVVLLAGGRDAAGNPLASAELYDPYTDSLLPIPGAMVAAREDHTATLLQNGRVLLAGGRGVSGTLSSAELYDPVTRSFLAVASAMTDSRVGHSAVALLDDRVLLAGGSKDGTDSSLSITADLFDPATGVISPAAGLMNFGRRNMGAAMAPDGLVTLLGGVYTPSVPLVYIGGQSFNPGTNTFNSFTSPLSTGRNRPLCSILADGHILALGGSSDLGATGDKNGVSPTGTLDVFNPVTTVFPVFGFNLPPVGTDQVGGRCLLLADGTVLLVGDALNGAGAPVGSVIYQ